MFLKINNLTVYKNFYILNIEIEKQGDNYYGFNKF